MPIRPGVAFLSTLRKGNQHAPNTEQRGPKLFLQGNGRICRVRHRGNGGCLLLPALERDHAHEVSEPLLQTCRYSLVWMADRRQASASGVLSSMSEDRERQLLQAYTALKIPYYNNNI